MCMCSIGTLQSLYWQCQLQPSTVFNLEAAELDDIRSRGHPALPLKAATALPHIRLLGELHTAPTQSDFTEAAVTVQPGSFCFQEVASIVLDVCCLQPKWRHSG